MGSPAAGGARGQSTVVGKALEVGIVVLYITLLTTALLAGAVPGYRSAAGQSLADRTVAAAAQEIRQAVPPVGRSVRVSRTVPLPATIAGASYSVRPEGRSLVLDHPRPGLESRVRLALPRRVDRVEGRWTSGSTPVVRVTGTETGVVVQLQDGMSP